MAHPDRYLTVDEVLSAITAQGEHVGRTTVYRNLEAMVAEGAVLKATAPGGEARYRLCPTSATGQLLCLSCGTAYPLDCHMVGEFSSHVLEHHGFALDPTRTVLYGTCKACRENVS